MMVQSTPAILKATLCWTKIKITPVDVFFCSFGCFFLLLHSIKWKRSCLTESKPKRKRNVTKKKQKKQKKQDIAKDLSIKKAAGKYGVPKKNMGEKTWGKSTYHKRSKACFGNLWKRQFAVFWKQRRGWVQYVLTPGQSWECWKLQTINNFLTSFIFFIFFPTEKWKISLNSLISLLFIPLKYI